MHLKNSATLCVLCGEKSGLGACPRVTIGIEDDESSMLNIDGNMGEGGGQILRTSLTLSLCTGRPFRMFNIRKGRQKPGLRAQHLAAVRAAAAISRAEVQGASLKSQQLLFTPRQLNPGRYHFDIGTSGSTSLVCQTLLPALLTAEGPSELLLEGGTHNPLAPPFEFLREAYLPLLARMGARVEVTLLRPGFFPAGGGKLRVKVEPAEGLQPLNLESREGRPMLFAKALLAKLPQHIAERELAVVEKELGIDAEHLTTESLTDTAGPGNALILSARCRNVTEVFAGFGMKGVWAETVAHRTVTAARRYLSGEAPVGEYLADQLLVPVCLAGGGCFRTLRPSSHTLTNIEVLHRFLGIRFKCHELGEDDWRIALQASSQALCRTPAVRF